MMKHSTSSGSVLSLLISFIFLLAVLPRPACAAKTALLVGIGDYSAEKITGPREPPVSDGSPPWRRPQIDSLAGPPNDLAVMGAILLGRYGFPAQNVMTLKDGAATRLGILEAIRRHLLVPAEAGDQILFYFSGHGSQRLNSASSEEDHLDETLVPADSLLGADDIRDKELQRLFNQILDSGAHLTVILDSCHSGSGARTLEDLLPARWAGYDSRDVRDPVREIAPEDRGAVILSATHDYGIAREAVAEDGTVQGAFTLALQRSVESASPQESVQHIYLRTKARLSAAGNVQVPVLAGTPAAKRSALFGGRVDHRSGRTVVAVEKVTAGGAVVLAGGRVHGLSVGSILELLLTDSLKSALQTRIRVEVTRLEGLSEAEARLMSDPRRDRQDSGRSLQSGDLLQVVLWARTPGDPFRVWIPGTEAGHDLGAEILRAEDSRFFPEMPIPDSLADVLEVGEGKQFSVVERTADPRRALYLLVGRHGPAGLELAWVRPGWTEEDPDESPLPGRSRWHVMPSTTNSRSEAEAQKDLAYEVSATASRLALVHRWLTLESPPQSGAFPYHLTLRRKGETLPVEDGASVFHGECLDLVLQAEEAPLWKGLEARFSYVFSLDSAGRGQLIFPNPNFGGVENLLPVSPATNMTGLHAAQKITLGPPSPAFCCRDPYGPDTFILLTTTEALPDPGILTFDGVRSLGLSSESSPPRSALEELLRQMGSGRRGESVALAGGWSLQRLTVVSRPRAVPGRSGGGPARSEGRFDQIP